MMADEICLSIKNPELWSLIEVDIGATFPNVIKHLLNLSGFNSLLAFKYFTSDDFQLLENTARGRFKERLNEADKAEFDEMCFDEGEFKLPTGIQRVLLDLSKQFEMKGFAKLSEKLNAEKKSNLGSLKSIAPRKNKKIPTRKKFESLKTHENVLIQLANNWIKNKFSEKEVQEKYLVKFVKVETEICGDLHGFIKCSLCTSSVRVHTKKNSENTIWIISNFIRHLQRHAQSPNSDCNSIRNWLKTSSVLLDPNENQSKDNNNHSDVNKENVHSNEDSGDALKFSDAPNGNNNYSDTNKDNIHGNCPDEASNENYNYTDGNEFVEEENIIEVEETQESNMTVEYLDSDSDNETTSSVLLRIEPVGNYWDDVNEKQ